MRRVYILILVIFNIPQSLVSQVIISDGSDVSGTWTLSNSPYLINGIATVPEGTTLTIEPGVEIKFQTGTDINYSGDNSVDVGVLMIKGTLICQGDAMNKIMFTRQGDTGHWGCVLFDKMASENSVLDHCIIEYGNSINSFQGFSYVGALAVYNKRIVLENSQIIHNNYRGLTIGGSTPVLRNNVIAYNQDWGIYIGSAFDYNDTIKLTNNTIVGNKNTGGVIRATCAIQNCIFWDNQRTLEDPYRHITITHSLIQEAFLKETSYLKIGEGNLFGSDPQLTPDFTLPLNSPCINAGTPDLTNLNLPDKDMLGNTRVNLGIIDMGATESTALKHIHIITPIGKQGFLPGVPVQITWSGNIDNVNLEYTLDGSSWDPIANNVPNDGRYEWTIPAQTSEFFNIHVSDASDPMVFDQCDRFCTVYSSSIPDSTRLSGRLTTEYSPYVIQGLVIVPYGDSLIIDPGVEIQFKTGTNYDFEADEATDVGVLYVQGKLIVKGTALEKVVFTRQGSVGNWGSIIFHKLAHPESIMDYCVVKYANRVMNLDFYYSYTGAVSVFNEKITLTNSLLCYNLYRAIMTRESTPIIHNNVIANNRGMGLMLDGLYDNSDTMKLMNNTFVGNGEAAVLVWGRCQVMNCIFWDNEQSFDIRRDLEISYSLVEEEELEPGWYSIQEGEGMIYAIEPQFFDVDLMDYHLKSTSPCIDGGDPDSDYSNEPPENGNRINQGAYGNTDEATLSLNLPRIRYISKKEGRMFGADTIQVKGANFLAIRGTGSARLRNTAAAEYLNWSEDSITFITPLVNHGLANLEIYNNNSERVYSPSIFDVKPPMITRLDPIYVNENTSEQIEFSGKFFGSTQNGNRIFFGDTEAFSYASWNDSLILLHCPEGKAGLMDLTFRANDSVYYTYPESFYYADGTVNEVCGDVSGTWTSGETYLLNCSVKVPSGLTLTIEPGVLVLVKQNPDDPVALIAEGKLEANGSSDNLIHFQSIPGQPGSWNGIELKDEGQLNYCEIRHGTDGVSVRNSRLTAHHTEISDCLNAGIKITAYDEDCTVDLSENTIRNNTYGIDGNAHASDAYCDISLEINSSNISENREDGIRMYASGSAGGYQVFLYRGSSINCMINNSILSSNQEHAVNMTSYGYRDTDYFPTVHRYGAVTLDMVNSLVYDNGLGLLAERESLTHATVEAVVSNSDFFNNQSTIQMNADKMFLYNSSLWDGRESADLNGFSDSLNVSNCNLNVLNNTIGEGNISEDPLYADVEQGDFHLQGSSPNIDAGNNAFISLDYDFEGNIRNWSEESFYAVDIGAFEYGAPCVNPEAPGIYQIGDTLYSDNPENNQWYMDGEAIETAIQKKYVATEEGFYYVRVTNAHGCISAPSNSISITYDPTHVDQTQEALRIYPNPTTGIILFTGLNPNESTGISIYNALGVLLLERKEVTGDLVLDISHFNPGIYYAIINHQNTQGLKIIKQ